MKKIVLSALSKPDLPHHMVTWLDAYLVYTAEMERIQGCMLSGW